MGKARVCFQKCGLLHIRTVWKAKILLRLIYGRSNNLTRIQPYINTQEDAGLEQYIHRHWHGTRSFELILASIRSSPAGDMENQHSAIDIAADEDRRRRRRERRARTAEEQEEAASMKGYNRVCANLPAAYANFRIACL